jgi:hypothetical protein
MTTCKSHADMMAAFVPVDLMGPKTRAIYDRFIKAGDQECIAHESQVVHLFMSAVNEDLTGHPIELPPS